MNKKDFTKTSSIKNYIYIDGINNKFIVKKHQFSSIFKPKVIHDFDEIKSIDLLQDGDFYCGKSSLLCRILFGAIGDFISRKKARYYCTEIELMITLEDNTKYYIDLIKNPIQKNSLKYKRAMKKANEMINDLNFILYSKEYMNSYLKDVPTISSRLVTE